ncbi:type VII secretion protein EssB/YukC [Bacillus licheniformis]|nr:type VII secretion protein EssB/YukC [Bacillus licheniformis]
MAEKRNVSRRPIRGRHDERRRYIYLSFQREKINLVNGLEANVIKEVDPSFNKEAVMTDDEVQIMIQPPSEYKEFRYIKGK